jgi:hypothetical protein
MNESNQSKICEICDFSPLGGGVVINQCFPKTILSKIKQNPGILFEQLKDPTKIQSLADSSMNRYWSYPKYDSNLVENNEEEGG